MRDSIQRVLRDGALVMVAFAIALGWSLYSVAQGASAFVTVLLNEIPNEPSGLGVDPIRYAYGSLTWRVGDRYLTFGPLVGGLVELAVVLAAAVLVYRWRDGDLRPRPLPDDPEPL